MGGCVKRVRERTLLHQVGEDRGGVCRRNNPLSPPPPPSTASLYSDRYRGGGIECGGNLQYSSSCSSVPSMTDPFIQVPYQYYSTLPRLHPSKVKENTKQ